MKTVSLEQVAAEGAVGGLGLPPRVEEALGELVSSAKEGLLALSVGVGSSSMSGTIVPLTDVRSPSASTCARTMPPNTGRLP